MKKKSFPLKRKVENLNPEREKSNNRKVIKDEILKSLQI
jgi:hypothetical protein